MYTETAANGFRGALANQMGGMYSNQQLEVPTVSLNAYSKLALSVCNLLQLPLYTPTEQYQKQEARCSFHRDASPALSIMRLVLTQRRFCEAPGFASCTPRTYVLALPVKNPAGCGFWYRFFPETNPPGKAMS